MKKRFTLMMMVLCILMSIPLKMMAQSVTYDEITVVSHYNQGTNWGPNSNFNFTTTDGKIYTCVLKDVTAENVWFRIVKNKSDMQWGPNSSKEDLVLTSSYQQAYESKTHEKSFKIENAQGSTYTITWDNETIRLCALRKEAIAALAAQPLSGILRKLIVLKVVSTLRDSISLVTSSAFNRKRMLIMVI